MTFELQAIFEQAVAGWRDNKHPRWASVADWAAGKLLAAAERPVVGAGRKKADAELWAALEKKGDPLDLARLVAAACTTSAAEAAERIALLAKRNDPRLITELIAILEAPPWRANVFKDFVRQVLQIFVDTKDIRARDAAADLSPRYKAIVETTVGDWVAAQLARTAKAMQKLELPKLTAPEESRLAEFETQMGKRVLPRASPQRLDDDQLIAMVYAKPDDDEPRLILADSLSDRGDARGEFIALQIQRFRGMGTPTLLRRERELAADPKRRTSWALPLANGGNFVFERGFVGALTLKPTTAKTILGNPAWATVRKVMGLETLSTKLALTFLEHPTLAQLQEVGSISQKIGDGLARRTRSWTSVYASYLPAPDLFETWNGLERLDLGDRSMWRSGDIIALDADISQRFAPLKKLVDFSIVIYSVLPDEFFASAPNIRRLRLRTLNPTRQLLMPLQQLQVLAVVVNQLDFSLFDGLKLNELELELAKVTRHNVDDLLAKVPTLQRLTLKNDIAWGSLDELLNLMAQHQLRRLDVSTPACRFSVETTPSDAQAVLTLDYLLDDLEPLFGSALKSGRIKEVRYPARIYGEDPHHYLSPDYRQVSMANTFFEKYGLTVLW